MDHCRNVSEPETAADGLLEAPAPVDRSEASPDARGTGSGDATGDTVAGDTATLDEWADGLRQAHLADALEELPELDAEQRAAVAECSRAIVDEVLRCPRWRLRNGDASASTVAALFDLED